MDLDKYVVLDEITMMLKRPDTFIGSVESKEVSTYIIDDFGHDPAFRTVNYSPALLKLFDEVLQNTYDHSKRPEGKHLNKIEVTLSPLTGEVSIADNAGIPVKMHPEHKLYIPCIIFGMLRSSTNYNDDEDREGGGRNGLGAKLTNIFSSQFKVETGDGENRYSKTYTNNRRDEEAPIITKGKVKGTRISFIPDYERLGCSMMADDNYGMMVTRVYELAACAPGIEVHLNGKKVETNSFEKFVAKFGKDYLYVSNSHWRIGLHHSNSGFKHISFCNATHTWLGGTHVEYLADQLVEGVREYVKKKTKQDVKPSDIRNHLFLMVDCTVYNPRFSSQTKEHMNLAIKDYGTTFRFDDAFFKKLIKSPIVEEIIEWAINRKKLQDMADLKKLNKDASKVSNKTIPKYEPASQKTNREQCTLFICEGDSAANPLISARIPSLHGVFALRGKPLQMSNAKVEVIKKNEEIKNLMAALGLEFGKPATNLRYGKIVLATDADMDGAHIRALMLNNFLNQWVEVLQNKQVYYLNTPIIRATSAKKSHEFFSIEGYEAWLAKYTGPKLTVKFLKGLGAHKTPDFKKYMVENEYIISLDLVDQYDVDMLNIAFGEADNKKTWLNIE